MVLTLTLILTIDNPNANPVLWLGWLTSPVVSERLIKIWMRAYTHVRHTRTNRVHIYKIVIGVPVK